ncbi:MAG TPA: sulfite exporter TauE/SafE family protein [Pyrinomonadaceae bacterium]|nr:sulfite exporter TauE/SafE family protein [Pyrinomonadaceae bacterium]
MTKPRGVEPPRGKAMTGHRTPNWGTAVGEDLMRLWKRTSLILLSVLCGAMFVAAHPLGNFSINHFARLELQPEKVRVHYVIDMAEIPTFQELQKLGTAPVSQAVLDQFAKRSASEFSQNLAVGFDATRISLTVVTAAASLRAGSGGMQTMRLEYDFDGLVPQSSAANHRVTFQDGNYAERIGWREIVVLAQPGITVFDSTTYAGSLSDELRNYPNEFLSAPLDEREAEFSFTTGAAPAGARLLQKRQATIGAARRDQLTELIAVPQLTLQIAFLGLLFAGFLGAVHAMSPGHGKAVVAAYLVGSRGTASHAAFLGLTVTVTHTAGVFALGLATLFASEYVVPERLYPKLSLLSGLVVAAIGMHLLIRRLQALFLPQPVNRDHHAHSHGEVEHHHDHQGAHSHLPPGADGSAITWRSLLALGISGGILPCPSALVVLLAAISLHRVGYGLFLVFAFSVGLAATLTTVGLVFVYAGRWLKASTRFYRLTRVLPVASSLVIVTAGLAICYAALDQSGYSVSEVINQLSARFSG